MPRKLYRGPICWLGGSRRASQGQEIGLLTEAVYRTVIEGGISVNAIIRSPRVKSLSLPRYKSISTITHLVENISLVLPEVLSNLDGHTNA